MSDSRAARQSAAGAVGPVLEAGPTAWAVIAVIRRHHPELSLLDRGAYLRVSVPRRCVLDLAELERELGHQFCVPGDLERIMPAFQGRLVFSPGQVVWEERAR
jgi:hypothetical protein